MTPPRLLWITPKWPLPAQDGARQATCRLIAALAAEGARISLLSYVDANEEKSSADVSELLSVLGVLEAKTVQKRAGSKLSHWLRAPLRAMTLSPYRSAEMRKSVFEACARARATDKAYDAVVFDGLHAGAWLQFTAEERAALPPLIYRAHNVETRLWEQTASASRNPLVRVVLNQQARAIAHFEGELTEASAFVAAVSEDDANLFRSLWKPAHAFALPIGLPFPKLESHTQPDVSAFKLLFIGKLDWRPNKEGLEWFLDQVWPEVLKRRSDIELTIAGAGPGEWIQARLPIERTRFLGRVPSVEGAYRDAHAALVPIFKGSGTRVKAIEASTFALPCISTALGVEGLGFDPANHYFNAETRDAWIELLVHIQRPQAATRGLAARDLLKDRFDPGQIARTFVEAIHVQFAR